MHSTSEPEPVIRLRADQFRRRCHLLGLDTAAEQAAHFRLSKWTVGRLLSGEIAPGERVMARILFWFPELDFKDFFEVVDASRVARKRTGAGKKRAA